MAFLFLFFSLSNYGCTSVPKTELTQMEKDKRIIYSKNKDYKITIAVNEPYRCYMYNRQQILLNLFPQIRNEFQNRGYQSEIYKPLLGYSKFSKQFEIKQCLNFKTALLVELKMYIVNDEYYKKNATNMYIQKIYKIRRQMTSEFKRLDGSEKCRFCNEHQNECKKFDNDLENILKIIDNEIQKCGGTIG